MKQRHLNSEFHFLQFDRLCQILNVKGEPLKVIKSYELEKSKVVVSDKIKETCYLGLIGAIYLSNYKTKTMEQTIELYNKFMEFIELN